MIVFAAQFTLAGVGWGDYLFDDLMGPSGISYQWMVINDNGETFGGTHTLAVDVSGDVITANDALLNVLSGTGRDQSPTEEMNAFSLVVAEGQGNFTMNFRVQS